VQRGGMIGYPAESLMVEVAFIAYYLHWPMDQIMSLDHRERQRWVAEVSKINEQLNTAGRE
jgi:hypothetical protein